MYSDSNRIIIIAKPRQWSMRGKMPWTDPWRFGLLCDSSMQSRCLFRNRDEIGKFRDMLRWWRKEVGVMDHGEVSELKKKAATRYGMSRRPVILPEALDISDE